MHTLTAVELCSLDGVMQSPGRPDEDDRGGFSQGGWASTHLAGDPEAAEAAMAGDTPTAALLFGHRTYLDLVGHWLAAPEPNPFADVLRSTPKLVVSRTPVDLPHPRSTALVGDAVETVARLKSSGEGDLVLMGSATLLHALQAADLVDGYVLTVVPVVLGHGTRLFDGAAPARMRLTSGVVTAGGAFVGHYRRASTTSPAPDLPGAGGQEIP